MWVHHADVRIEMGAHVGAGTGPVTDIQTGDTPLDHTTLLLKAQALDLKNQQLCLYLFPQRSVATVYDCAQVSSLVQS